MRRAYEAATLNGMDIYLFLQIVSAVIVGNVIFGSLVWVFWHIRRADRLQLGADGIPTPALLTALAVAGFLVLVWNWT